MASRSSGSGSGTSSTVTAATAWSMFLANPSMQPVAISDTTANIGKYLDSLELMAEAGRIASIALTDTGTIAIADARYTADAKVVVFLPQRGIFAVSAASAARGAALQADARVLSFAVTDSSAGVSAALDALNAESKLTAVALTDTAPIAMTYAQYATDKFVLGKLPKTVLYAVSKVAVSYAGSMQSNARVASFAVADTATAVGAAVSTLNGYAKLTDVRVADTAANVTAQLAALGAVARLSSIVVSDTDLLALDATVYKANVAVLAKLAPGEAISVAHAQAPDIAAIAADPRVARVAVVDTLARVGANLDALNAAAVAGKLSRIDVSDQGGFLILTPEKYTADAQAIGLMSGSFLIVQSPANKVPVFDLQWNASVAGAPAAFKSAMQYAAGIFDALIQSPVTVHVSVGWGEARGQALDPGMIGESYIRTGLFRTYAEYKADLTAHAASTAALSAAANLADPGGNIFVAGGQAKALGEIDAQGAAVDADIGFSSSVAFAFDPNARAVPGAIDFVGLALHELSHALGRVSYAGVPTGFDMQRYLAPGAHAAPGAGPAYLSVDGGSTNLGGLSTTGNSADWDSTRTNDVSSAFLPAGIALTLSSSDLIGLAALGWAVNTPAVGPFATTGTGTSTTGLTGSGARMTFAAPDATRSSAPAWNADWRALPPADVFPEPPSGAGAWIVEPVSGAASWDPTRPPAPSVWVDRFGDGGRLSRGDDAFGFEFVGARPRLELLSPALGVEPWRDAAGFDVERLADDKDVVGEFRLVVGQRPLLVRRAGHREEIAAVAAEPVDLGARR
jgi:hypothetical protein